MQVEVETPSEPISLIEEDNSMWTKQQKMATEVAYEVRHLKALMRDKMDKDRISTFLFKEWVTKEAKSFMKYPTRSYEADVDLISDYLQVFSKKKMMPPSEINKVGALHLVLCYMDSLDSVVDYESECAITFMCNCISFALQSNKCLLAYEVNNSLLSFERKGSIFNHLWYFSKNNVKDALLHLFGKKPPKRALRKERIPYTRNELPLKEDNSCMTTIEATQDDNGAKDKDWIQLEMVLRTRVKSKEVYDRVMKYLESQKKHFHCIPLRRPYKEEVQWMKDYYDLLIKRGASAKSTAIHWLLKFLQSFDGTFDQVKTFSCLTFMSKFMLWIVEEHWPKSPPESFFRYKAYFPYFWCYARGDSFQTFEKLSGEKLGLEQENGERQKSRSRNKTVGFKKEKEELKVQEPLKVKIRLSTKRFTVPTIMRELGITREMLKQNMASDDIGFLLSKLGIDGKYTSVLNENGIDVMVLMSIIQTDDDGILKDIGLPLGPQKLLQMAVHELKKSISIKLKQANLKRKNEQISKDSPNAQNPPKQKQIIGRKKRIFEPSRPFCSQCGNPCSVHRRDKATNIIVSWRCRPCGWQGIKAQELMCVGTSAENEAIEKSPLHKGGS